MPRLVEYRLYQYMQCLQPVDPDEQKERIMRKYEHEFQAASIKFTTVIQRKTVNLLKNVNLIIFQHIFPSLFLVGSHLLYLHFQ